MGYSPVSTQQEIDHAAGCLSKGEVVCAYCGVFVPSLKYNVRRHCESRKHQARVQSGQFCNIDDVIRGIDVDNEVKEDKEREKLTIETAKQKEELALDQAMISAVLVARGLSYEDIEALFGTPDSIGFQYVRLMTEKNESLQSLIN